MQFAPTLLAALASVASAQTVHVVTVASSNNSLIYTPNNVKAAVGDMVQFQFVAGNHTVTQSTFDQPCRPIDTVMTNVTGFHSGYMPAAASASTGMIPTYTIMINNTRPVWAYCAQGRHCANGMVMVINEDTAANATRSLANFKKLASEQTSSSAPGSSTGGSTGDTNSGSSSGTGSTGGSTGTGSGTTTTAGSNMVKVGSSLGLVVLAAAVTLM
ncbi:unnamed protein product [Discula destructiva]